MLLNKKIEYKKFTKYIIISLITTVINILIYIICAELFKLNEIISNTIAWIISVFITFFLNKIFVFNSRDFSKKTYIELIKFYLLRITSLIIDTIVLYICLKYFALNNVTAKIISNIGTTFNNYFISKYFIFKSNSIKNERNEI